MKTKILSILALLLTVTQGAWAASVNCLPSDIGKVLGTDGKVYATVDAAGGISNVSGMIAYVNGTTGIAIGPSDLLWNSSDGSQKMPVSDALNACNNYTKNRPSAATTVWRLPSQADFNNMIGANGCESANNLRNMIGRQASSCGCAGMRTDEGYWSSTQSGSGIYYNLWSTNCDAVATRDNEKYVRPCFTFNVTPNYTISFNANGGSGSVASQTKFEDTDITLPSSGFTRDGYTFAGWNTQADGNGTPYAAGATYSANAAVTLYAQWTCNTTTSGIDWDPSTNSGTFLMPAYNVEVSTELWYLVNETKTLDENIAAYGTKSDFFLNRTLKANVWNTFASPFAIAEENMTKYFGAGAKVRQLNTTEVAENVLTLNFTDANEIVAGQPYLVKPAANVDFSADGKEFAGVDLNAAEPTATTTTYVNFIPTLGVTEVTGNVKDILILNTDGKLVHPSAVGNMKGFRGYFVMNEAVSAREFIMNFGDGETTGIQPIRMENGTTPAEGTYDLSGRRIQGQPTQKGVYIQNGKKVIIK